MMIQNALDSFILDQRLKGSTEKTVSGYEWFIGKFITWLADFGVENANSLTVQHTQGYQLHLCSRQCENKNQPLTRRTVRTYMRHVRIFLSFCFAESIINEPIHIKMKLPKAEKPVIEILTDEESSHLLSRFGDDVLGCRDRAIICLMLDCGLRLSEVAGLRLSDINFDNRYIKVTGKGRKQRIVPIGQLAVQAVVKYNYRRNASGREQLFFSSRQSPLTPSGIGQLMKRLKAQTGILRLHAHLLRHTFATNYLIYGIGDVYELSRILGHADIKITEGYVQLANYYKLLQNRNRQTYLDIKEARQVNEG
ncbi:MAG: tyrosine-type recombinase/integrase [Defluviitaleaceae bacterium]|nr:tyrosine-type recombinase/integrase [Defluviitaleaceae bacterium]